MNQTPTDIWQIMLRVFAWAARIPVACMVVFSAGCLSFLLFVLIYRITVWIYFTLLQSPWH